jgi:hypothetical protein
MERIGDVFYEALSSQTIQDVPGGKVSILGGHIIDYSKQKVYMYMCPIPNCFRDKATGGSDKSLAL